MSLAGSPSAPVMIPLTPKSKPPSWARAGDGTVNARTTAPARQIVLISSPFSPSDLDRCRLGGNPSLPELIPSTAPHAEDRLRHPLRHSSPRGRLPACHRGGGRPGPLCTQV